MKKHPEIGKQILATGSLPYIKMGALIALTHHECWDGSGYLSGTKEKEMPLPGRIMLLSANTMLFGVSAVQTTARPSRRREDGDQGG